MITEVYPNMEHFPKIVNSFKPLKIFPKCSILDVSKGSEYAYETSRPVAWNDLNSLHNSKAIADMKQSIQEWTE